MFGEPDRLDKDELEIAKTRIENMDFIERTSMVRDNIEANIFKANFQSLNF